jgi:hypothetical protein
MASLSWDELDEESNHGLALYLDGVLDAETHTRTSFLFSAAE